MTRSKKSGARVLDDLDKVIVETSRGVHVECHAIIAEIEAQEENIRAQFEWPDVPQRDISHTVPPDAGPEWPRTTGLTQAHVDGDFSTDEEKAVWTEYTDEHASVNAEFSAKLNDARLRLLVLRGVTLIDAKPEEEWIQEHEWLGMVVPENPLDRRLHYFRTEVLGTPMDVFAITKGIYRAGGMDAEVLDRFEDSFRDQMERAVREALEADQGDTTGEQSREEEGVVG